MKFQKIVNKQVEEVQITCFACHGEHKKLKEEMSGIYVVIICRWCSCGRMSQAQASKWNSYVLKRKEEQQKPKPQSGVRLKARL